MGSGLGEKNMKYITVSYFTLNISVVLIFFPLGENYCDGFNEYLEEEIIIYISPQINI